VTAAGRPDTARRLGGQTLYVLAGNLFTLAIGLPFQIYVSRVLGAEGVGAFGLVDAAIVTIVGFLNFGIPAIAVRFVPQHMAERHYGNLRRLVRLGAAASVAIGIFGMLAAMLLLEPLLRLWPELAPYRTLVLVMCVMLPVSLTILFLQQSLRGFQDIRYLVLGSSFLQLSAKVLLTILLFSFGLAVEGYAAAVVLSSSAALLWMAHGLRRKVRALPQGEAGEPAQTGIWWQYGLTAYANALILTGTDSLDRFALGYFSGAAAVGVFVVMRQLQALPLAFNQMLLMVIAPMFASAHSRGDASERQHLYTLMTDWVVRAAFPLLLFLFIFAEALLGLFGPEFAELGAWPLRIIIAAELFNLASGPNGNVTMMCGLERISVRLAIATMIVKLVLLLALTPLLGLLGAALAAAAANVMTNLICLWLIRTRLRMNWWDRRYLGWLAPGAAALTPALAALWVLPAPGALWLGVLLTAMYAAFAAVSFLQGLNEDDRALLQHVRARLSASEQ